MNRGEHFDQGGRKLQGDGEIYINRNLIIYMLIAKYYYSEHVKENKKQSGNAASNKKLQKCTKK
jgi:hypothetical protein